MDGGMTILGGVGARTLSGFIPLADGGVMGVVKAVGAAIAVSFAAGKVVSGDKHRFIRAGAYAYAVKQLVTTFVPQVGAMLGDYDGQIGAGTIDVDASNAQVGGYNDDVSGIGELYEGVGEYSGY